MIRIHPSLAVLTAAALASGASVAQELELSDFRTMRRNFSSATAKLPCRIFPTRRRRTILSRLDARCSSGHISVPLTGTAKRLTIMRRWHLCACMRLRIRQSSGGSSREGDMGTSPNGNDRDLVVACRFAAVTGRIVGSGMTWKAMAGMRFPSERRGAPTSCWNDATNGVRGHLAK